MLRSIYSTLLAFGTVLALLLTSSATTLCAQSQSDDETTLKARANQYWQLKIDGKFDKAYEFEDPETIKDLNLTEYVRSVGSGVKWLKADAAKVVRKDDRAAVLMTIRYHWTFVRDNPKEGFEGTFYDQWRLVNGAWYHMFKKPGKPPSITDQKKQAPFEASQTSTPEQGGKVEPSEKAESEKSQDQDNKE